jgi:hypothetical protein
MINKKILLLGTMLFCAVMTQAQDGLSTETSDLGITGTDSPDLSKEAEFHRIYKSFNMQPTEEETWGQVLTGRSAENYNVQKGDTLSGISTTLFGDQFYWPKIWSLNNQQILNPHEISPGMVVQFFPGSSDDAPAVILTEMPAENENSGDKKNEKKETVQKRVEIPPPKKKLEPVLTSFPKSLPPFSSILGLSEKKEEVFIEINTPKYKTAMEPLSYYIADDPIEGVGKIIGVEMDLTAAGEHQYIFVKLNEPMEKLFAVQKNLGKVKDSDSWWRRGNIVEVQGEIEILDKVNSDKSIYRAIVRRAIGRVEVGSLLTPGKMPVIDPLPGELGPNIEASIIGGQYDDKRKLFGSHSFVYLNGGESKGIKEGQTLAIYAEERLRTNKVDSVENNRIIGKLKVVRVTPYFATAYIAEITDDVFVGDHVGKPGRAQARAEPSESDKESGPEPISDERPNDSGDEADLDL